MPQRNARRVTPTAYATGNFWVRHGMSHPALWTPQGAWLGHGFGAFTRITRLMSGISLDVLMLARHVGIDAVLDAAIRDGRVTQVLELAAGLSGRGIRFARRYGDRLTYLETDLPHMAALKQGRLEQAQLLTQHHRVLALDALAEHGPAALPAVAALLDPRQGLAIITEGLMNYLSPAAATAVWQRIANVLRGFRHGVYLSDFYLLDENRSLAMAAFGGALSTFVGGRVHVHFRSPDQARRVLQGYGFSAVDIHRTADIPATRHLARSAGADRVRILAARTPLKAVPRRAPVHRTPAPPQRSSATPGYKAGNTRKPAP